MYKEAPKWDRASNSFKYCPTSRSSSSSGLAPSSSPSTPSCWAAPSPSSRVCVCWDTASCLWLLPWPCAGSCCSAARGRSASLCGWQWSQRPLDGPHSPRRPSSPTASRPIARGWWCTRCSSSTLWSDGWSWRSRHHSRRQMEGEVVNWTGTNLWGFCGGTEHSRACEWRRRTNWLKVSLRIYTHRTHEWSWRTCGRRRVKKRINTFIFFQFFA